MATFGWQQLFPSLPSAFIHYQGMVWDSAHSKHVLFSGGNDAATNKAWTFNLGTNTWTDIGQPDSTLIGRRAVAFDEANNQVVAFGGFIQSSSTVVNDTWTYDGTTWTHRSPAHSPSARYYSPMAYCPNLGAVVMYGGSSAGTGGVNLNDTWKWDGTDWTQLSPAHNIGFNFSSSLAKLADGNVYGYNGYNGTSTPTINTWKFNGSDWSVVSTAHKPTSATDSTGFRSSYGLVYWSTLNKIILFGGIDVTNAKLNDVWSFDGTDWTQEFPAGSLPVIRDEMAVSYQPGQNAMVLHGGETGAPGTNAAVNDTWKLVLQNVTAHPGHGIEGMKGSGKRNSILHRTIHSPTLRARFRA